MIIDLSKIIESRLKRAVLFNAICFLNDCLKNSSANTYKFCCYVIDNVNPVTVKEHDGFIIDEDENHVSFKCGILGYDYRLGSDSDEKIDNFGLNLRLCSLMQIAKDVCSLLNNYKLSLTEIFGCEEE